jgi:hypothetical protein
MVERQMGYQRRCTIYCTSSGLSLDMHVELRQASKLSEEELESFAETVKGAIVQGDIQLEGWTAGLHVR